MPIKSPFLPPKMMPRTFYRHNKLPTFGGRQYPADHPTPNDLPQEPPIYDTAPQGQLQPGGVLDLGAHQISRHGADIDTYQVALKSANRPDISAVAIKTVRLAQGDFDRREAINLFYAMLASEWRKLDEKHKNVSRVWMSEAKIAGLTVEVMASPWYENGDVLAYVRSAPDVSPVDLARQVASGLGYLHSRSVVHGDIYPGNVMITREKTACLINVGVHTLANRCLYIDSTPLSSAWRYKAPEELAAGEGYMRANDVYEFAGTVYAMITSTEPFEDRTFGAVLQEIIQEGHCRFLEQSDHAKMTGDLRRILRRCWSFKPEQRPGIMEVKGQFQEL